MRSLNQIATLTSMGPDPKEGAPSPAIANARTELAYVRHAKGPILAHEHAHWTGHQSRLDRTFGKKFGDKAYALEELVALSGQSAPCLTHH